MARFKAVENNAQTQQLNQLSQTNNYPFKNFYSCVEGDMVYVNMESVENLTKGMTTLRDMGIIIDISGSMDRYYRSKAVHEMCRKIVEAVASYDDDGIDLLFFANGLVYNQTVRNVGEVDDAIKKASKARGAFGSTMPTKAFKEFTQQLKRKNRAGTVLFLTDGAMDDDGKELLNFYQNHLHTEFKTRDSFYCYAIEFGPGANGALDVLDGLYKPDQGPEDLFDLDSSDDLDKIANVLSQVGAMSAIGSNVEVSASVDSGVIDMVNADLIEGGMTSIQGAINKMMSFRVRTRSPFVLSLQIQGYNPMRLRITPNGLNADIQVL